jgi:copper homeostasis protein (lipoprotein)
MRISTISFIVFGVAAMLLSACGDNDKQGKKDEPDVIRGLYSFGPEVRSLQECGGEKEFWVTDSSAQLELQYSQMNFEKPYLPVYVEVEGKKIPSDKDGLGADFDSTLVVYKVLKITKEIPADSCR